MHASVVRTEPQTKHVLFVFLKVFLNAVDRGRRLSECGEKGWLQTPARFRIQATFDGTWVSLMALASSEQVKDTRWLCTWDWLQ